MQKPGLQKRVTPVAETISRQQKILSLISLWLPTKSRKKTFTSLDSLLSRLLFNKSGSQDLFFFSYPHRAHTHFLAGCSRGLAKSMGFRKKFLQPFRTVTTIVVHSESLTFLAYVFSFKKISWNWHKNS